MRLIDADALKEALKANCGTLCNDKNTDWCEYCCPHNDFEDLIDNAPTADESDIQAMLNKRCMAIITNEYLIALQGKRLKGKWIPQTDYDGFTYWKCSECGKKNDYEITDFCFRCGADMRKEAENDS